jgi:hypothetical protein
MEVTIPMSAFHSRVSSPPCPLGGEEVEGEALVWTVDEDVRMVVGEYRAFMPLVGAGGERPGWRVGMQSLVLWYVGRADTWAPVKERQNGDDGFKRGALWGRWLSEDRQMGGMKDAAKVAADLIPFGNLSP